MGNIIFNLSIEGYKKKYRNGRYKLLKHTKKEVADYDKIANQTYKTKNYLLKGRKWALIGDTYYEIPKAPRVLWFRNINAGVKAATYALVGGAVIGGASYGIYTAIVSKQPVKPEPTPVFDGKVTLTEWNNAIKSVTDEKDNRNFTCLVTTLLDQYKYYEKGLTEQIKIVKDGTESYRGYRKKEGSAYYSYDTEKWEQIRNGGFSWYDTIEEDIRLDKFKDLQSNFSFSNGKYKYDIPEGSSVNATSVYIEFNEDKSISKFIVENTNITTLEGKPSQYIYEFSNYGKTEVTDLPDPEPEYSKQFVFELNELNDTVTLTGVKEEFLEEHPDEIYIPETVAGDYCGGNSGEEYTLDTLGEGAFSGVRFPTTIRAQAVRYFKQDCLSGPGIASVECAQDAVLYDNNGNSYNVGTMSGGDVANLFKSDGALNKAALTKPKNADLFNYEIKEDGTLKATLKSKPESTYLSIPETIYGDFFETEGAEKGKEYIVTEIGQFPETISADIKQFEIPEFVTHINPGTFDNCNSAWVIYFNDQSSKWFIDNEEIDITYPDFNAIKLKKNGEWSNKTLTKESTEDKFFGLYSQYSNKFQNSLDEYDYNSMRIGLDYQYTFAGTHYYINSDGERVFKAAVIDDLSGSNFEITLAGGEDLTYYDDSTKGIKALIERYKADGYLIKYTFSENDSICGFKVLSNNEIIAEYKFNSNGYGTLVHSDYIDDDIHASYYYQDPVNRSVILSKNNNTYSNEFKTQLYNDYERTFEINVEEDAPVNRIEFIDDYTTVGFSFVRVLVNGEEVQFTIEDSNIIKLSNSVSEPGSKIEIITIPSMEDGSNAFYVTATASYADEPTPGEWTLISRDDFVNNFERSIGTFNDYHPEYDESQISSISMKGEEKTIDYLECTPTSCMLHTADGDVFDIALYQYQNQIDTLFPVGSPSCAYFANLSAGEVKAVNSQTNSELIFNFEGYVIKNIEGTTITYSDYPTIRGRFVDTNTGASESMIVDQTKSYNIHLVTDKQKTCAGMQITVDGASIDPRQYFDSYEVVVNGQKVTPEIQGANFIKFGDSGATGTNFVVKFKPKSTQHRIANVVFQYKINA